MSQNLQTFEHEVFGSIRVVERDNEPWFVATDVCRCLDLEQVTRAVSRLRDTQRGVTSIKGKAGLREMNIVSESGLYALIFTSRKKEAIAFQDWVCEEVLPSIRKHGAYVQDQSAIINTLEKMESRIRTLETGRLQALNDRKPMLDPKQCGYLIEKAVEATNRQLYGTVNRDDGWMTTIEMAYTLGKSEGSIRRMRRQGVFECKLSMSPRGHAMYLLRINNAMNQKKQIGGLK